MCYCSLVGLVAGGAALGLGAAAMGRFFSPVESMRNLQDPNNLPVDSENLVFLLENPEDSKTRSKRSLLIADDDELQMSSDVSKSKSDKLGGLMNPQFWADTPCSKRIFCHVMLQQHPDEVMFMEKKMIRLTSS